MIRLLKQNKKTGIVEEKTFENFEQLEKTLRLISTVKHRKFFYGIESDDFAELKKVFKDNYNEEYFKIDEDFKIINISPLKVGKKRNKKFVKYNQTYKDIAESACHRLQDKYPTIYFSRDSDYIYLYYFNAKLEFFVNKDLTIERKGLIPGEDMLSLTFQEIEYIIKKSKQLVDYFSRLSKRTNKKGND